MDWRLTWIALLHAICINLSHSLATEWNQSAFVASLQDECYLSDRVALSFFQKAAHFQLGSHAAERKTFRKPIEDDQVQASCGRTSVLQQSPESAIQIPKVLRDDFQLLQVQAVIRHGAPIEIRDTECPNLHGVQWNCSVLPPQTEAFISGFNENPGDCQFGQLLDWGYEQQVANGKALHAAYIKSGVLGPCPRVFSYSDDGADLQYVRTAQSKVALLSALFDGHSYAHVDQSSDYSIFFTDLNNGAPWALKAGSRGILRDIYDFSMSDVSRRSRELGTALDCVEEGVCNEVGTPIDADMFQSTLQAAIDGASKYYGHSWMNGSLSQASFESSEFIVNILDKLDSIGSTHASQFVLWSSHDTALFSLALTLGFELETWPPYASVFLLEVWEDSATKVRFVRILYQGEDVTMKVPVCATYSTADGLCPLNAFRNIWSAQIELVRKSGLNLRMPAALNFSGKQCR